MSHLHPLRGQAFGAVERAVPPAEAASRATAALTALGLRARLEDAGAGRDPTAWWCGLYDDAAPLAWALDGAAQEGTPLACGLDGALGRAPLACGMGKGWREEARLGALFEAIEHYLTGPAGFEPRAVEPAAPAAVTAGPLGADVCGLLLARMPGRRMACLRYRALSGSGRTLVPMFLSAPWYVETGAEGLRELAGDDCDYADLMRYSCNSGSAVGVTRVEALLHALNETIERDALSLLLVRAFLAGEPLRPTLIDPGTLPHDLARAHVTAEELTGSPVHLLDITSDLGVPTMLAYTAPTSRQRHRRGTGTSLSPAYAAWRGLTELVQTTLGESLPGLAGDPTAPTAHTDGDLTAPAAHTAGDLAALVAYPALHACGRFDLSEALRRARVVPFPQDAEAVGTPDDQLRAVAARLRSRGLTVYFRTVRALAGGVTAVHVVVPLLERFMLVTKGNLVVPGHRGQQVAAGSRSHARGIAENLPHD